MDFSTGGNGHAPRPSPRRRPPLRIGLLLIAVLILVVLAVLLLRGFGPPSSEAIVLAFEDQGLEVGDSYPIEEEEMWAESPVPKVHEEATRFEIPSLGEDAGGRVFVFEDRDDLKTVRNYYAKMGNLPIFGEELDSHLYADGLVLVQINGELAKPKADRYGEAMAAEV